MALLAAKREKQGKRLAKTGPRRKKFDPEEAKARAEAREKGKKKE